MDYTSSINRIREELDEVDEQMLFLFQKRMGIIDRIAEIKRINNIAITDEVREQNMINRALSLGNPIKGDIISFMRSLLGLSKLRQRRHIYDNTEQQLLPMPRKPDNNLPVAYRGLPGDYGDQAVSFIFGERKRHNYESFEEVFSAVKDKGGCYGVVPVENSDTGAIGEVYDLLRRYGCYIVGQTRIRTNNNNLTRFIAIADAPEYDDSCDMVSITFRTALRSGALCEVLFPLMAEGISLSRIESRSLSGEDRFCFFADLEGNILDESIARGIRHAAASCGYLEVLGCYKEISGRK